MPIYALGTAEPTIDETAYIHPDAVIIGDVHVGAHASVWPTAVVRADYNRVDIGAHTSIQDGTVIHIGRDKPTVVGARCVVGHNAYLEGCTVEDDCLVGSMAVLLHDVVIYSGALVAAGAVITPGTKVPARAMAVGVPAAIRLEAVDAAKQHMQADAVRRYVANAQRFASELRRLG
jgi:carbonic anhydrase/acetyltransferase-like protein (isoleucine patch superfamily)